MAQLFDHTVNLFPTAAMRVENRFGVIEDDQHFFGGYEWVEGGQVFRILNIGADDRRESAEEIGPRGWELIAADEPSVDAKLLLDAIVMEDGQRDGCFTNPPWTNESNWSEVLSVINGLFDQFFASKTYPRRRGRKFARSDAAED